jgi:hypothetical protein
VQACDDLVLFLVPLYRSLSSGFIVSEEKDKEKEERERIGLFGCGLEPRWEKCGLGPVGLLM